MIERVVSRAQRGHRQAHRQILSDFLEWATHHAGEPFRGRPIDPEGDLLFAFTRAVRELLDRLCGRGVFAYFGLVGDDCATAPVRLVQVTTHGAIALDVDPLANWIMDGGDHAAGWCAPHELTIDDLD